MKKTRNLRWALMAIAATALIATACMSQETNRTTVPQDTPDNWASVSAGGNHTVAIDKDGNLFIWGASYQGELGFSDGMGQLNEPTQLTNPGFKCSKIASGNYTSFAINVNGDLYSWGNNSVGELGRKDENDGDIPHNIPGKVDHPKGGKWRSVHMLAGTDFVLAIDEEGRLWAWGENFHGQIGNGYSGDGTIVREPFQIILAEAPNATCCPQARLSGRKAITWAAYQWRS